MDGKEIQEKEKALKVNHSNANFMSTFEKKEGKIPRKVPKQKDCLICKVENCLRLVAPPLYVFYQIIQTFQNAAQRGKNQMLRCTEIEKPGEGPDNSDASQFQGKKLKESEGMVRVCGEGMSVNHCVNT